MDKIQKLISINVNLYRLFQHLDKGDVVLELIDDFLEEEKKFIHAMKSLEEQRSLCAYLNYDLEDEYHKEFAGLSLRERDLVMQRLLLSLSYYFDFEIMKGNIDLSYAETADFVVGKRIKELKTHYEQYLKTKRYLSSLVVNSLKDVYKNDVFYLFSANVTSLHDLEKKPKLSHQISDDEVSILVHEFGIYLEAAMQENNYQDFEVSCYMMLGILKIFPVEKMAMLQTEVIHLMSSIEMNVCDSFERVINTILRPVFICEAKDEESSALSSEVYTYEDIKAYTLLYSDFKILEGKIWKYQGNEFVLAKLLKEEDYLLNSIENPHKFAHFLKDVCEEDHEQSDFEILARAEKEKDALDDLWMRRVEDKAILAARSVGQIVLPDETQIQLNMDSSDIMEMMNSREIQDSFLDYQTSKITIQELIDIIKNFAFTTYGNGQNYISKSDRILGLCRLHYLVSQNVDDALLKNQLLYRYNLIQTQHVLGFNQQLSDQEDRIIHYICDDYLASMEAKTNGKKEASSILKCYKDIYQSNILKKKRTKG